MLAVAVVDIGTTTAASSTTVQGVDLFWRYLGSLYGPLTAKLAGAWASGIATGDGPNALYLQCNTGLAGGSTLLQPTIPQNGQPTYYGHSFVYYAGNLYVLGQVETGTGVLRFDAATGNPNGNGTDPLFLPIDINTALGLQSMGLVTAEGGTFAALVICAAIGVYACVLSEGGNAPAAALLGPVGYTQFQGQGVTASLSLLGPQQSPTSGAIYFLYFDNLALSWQYGVLSVQVNDLVAAFGLNQQIPADVITPITAINVPTGAWCIGDSFGQDVVYVALPISSGTTSQWSIERISTENGTISPFVGPQPGYPSAMCTVNWQMVVFFPEA